MLIRILKGAFDKLKRAFGKSEPDLPSANPFPDAKQGSVVVVSFGDSRSHPFKYMAKMLADAYESRGLHCHVLDLMQATWPNPPLEALFAANQVRYGVGWGGVGWDAVLMPKGHTLNAWASMRKPFFKLIGDHPAYFLDLNLSPHPTFINTYAFTEHRDFFSRHLKPQGYGSVLALQQMDPLDPDQLDFKAKQNGKIYFLKNGNDPERLRRDWRARLPESVAAGLLAMSEDLRSTLGAERAWRLDDLIISHFAAQGLDITQKVKFLAFHIAQLDDYMRRVKSTMIAESLLDFPIEVHGECWDHIDFSGRRAKLVPFGDYAISRQLIAESLAVIDMAPNTQQQPHERYIRCASRHTLCLTNRNAYLEREFEPLGQPLFEFTPDSIRATVNAVLEEPARHVQIGREIGAEFKRRYSPTGIVDQLEMIADQISVQEGEDPQIQPFFIWPKKI